MRAYLSVRNWVDGLWKWSGMQIKATLALPIFVLLGASFVDILMVWIAAALVSLAWISFVFWRGWRRLKVEAVKGDRAYDRVGKYKLAEEYHKTASATATRRNSHG